MKNSIAYWANPASINATDVLSVSFYPQSYEIDDVEKSYRFFLAKALRCFVEILYIANNISSIIMKNIETKETRENK